MPAASKQETTPDIPIPDVLEKVKLGITTESFLLTGETGKLVSALESAFPFITYRDLFRAVSLVKLSKK